MNYISWIQHSLFDPQVYHRRYDLDLPKKTGAIQVDLARRSLLASLPFVALYRPAGSALSMGLGGARVFSHLNQAFLAQNKREWEKLSSELFYSACAAGAVASSVFSFRLGLLATTSMDVMQALIQVAQKGAEGEWNGAFEEAMQTGSSALYLAFMVTGGLEAILLATLVQGCICLYQAREAIDKEHYIEALGKIALGFVKGYQVQQYRTLIRRRDDLHTLKKYQGFLKRVQRAKETKHLLSSSLGSKEKETTLSNLEREYDFGTHEHGYGKGLVKGANISFREVAVEGKAVKELSFKVNHVFRDQLQKTLEDLSYLKPSEVQEMLQLGGLNVEGVSVEKEVGGISSLLDFYWSDGKQPVWKITAKGLGVLRVGASVPIAKLDEDIKVSNLYDKVTVQLEEGKNLHDCHALLSLVGLDEGLQRSTKSDLDRLKLGHLFRTFFPKEALSLERDSLFFSTAIDDLKKEMVTRAPQMKEVYDTYFERMVPAEVLPGRVRYQIEGLSEEVAKHQMAHLTAAITGPQDNQTLFARVASMLSMGMLSTEVKDTYRVNAQGLSRLADYSSGGADSIFTQLMHKDFIEGKRPLEEMSCYKSRVRLLISLKAVEMGSYQYSKCGAGNREPDEEFFGRFSRASYPKRKNIIDFAQDLDEVVREGIPLRTHEVMLKERLDPSFFEGMVVPDEKTKRDLTVYLKNQGLIQTDAQGRETLQGKLLDQWFHIIPSKFEECTT